MIPLVSLLFHPKFPKVLLSPPRFYIRKIIIKFVHFHCFFYCLIHFSYLRFLFILSQIVSFVYVFPIAVLEYHMRTHISIGKTHKYVHIYSSILYVYVFFL